MTEKKFFLKANVIEEGEEKTPLIKVLIQIR